jgi:hypothetical protein
MCRAHPWGLPGGLTCVRDGDHPDDPAAHVYRGAYVADRHDASEGAET